MFVPITTKQLLAMDQVLRGDFFEPGLGHFFNRITATNDWATWLYSGQPDSRCLLCGGTSDVHRDGCKAEAVIIALSKYYFERLHGTKLLTLVRVGQAVMAKAIEARRDEAVWGVFYSEGKCRKCEGEPGQHREDCDLGQLEQGLSDYLPDSLRGIPHEWLDQNDRAGSTLQLYLADLLEKPLLVPNAT